MIRSRSIPIVLSRVAGDGIHAILLIDNDGELLGSYGSPPPRHPAQDETNCGGVASGGRFAAAAPDMKWPLDAASIGALISEVAGDYSRMGEDLLLLDPRNYSQRHQLGGGSGGGVDRRRGHEGGQIMDNGGMQQPGGVDSGTSSLQQSGHNARKPDKDKLMDSGTNLKSLVVELDYGVVGVASAGPGFYVIALADSTVQHGALVGRLRALGTQAGEALSQLDYNKS